MPELSRRTLEKVIMALGEVLPDNADTLPLMQDVKVRDKATA
jgi:hypothetical protein